MKDGSAATRLKPEHVSILNTLDHGGELHAFDLGEAQSVGKQLAGKVAA